MHVVIAATNALCGTILTQSFQSTPRPRSDGFSPEYQTAEVSHAIADANSAFSPLPPVQQPRHSLVLSGPQEYEAYEEGMVQ